MSAISTLGIYLGAILSVACWLPVVIEVLADRCPAMQLRLVGPGIAFLGVIVGALALDKAQERGGHAFGVAIFAIGANAWFLACAAMSWFFWPLLYFFSC